MTKILFIGDLHGRMPRIHFKDFDYIVMVGDIASDKYLRPYYKKWFRLIKKVGKDVMNFSDFMDKEFEKGGYEKLSEKQMDIGREIMKKMNSYGVPVFVIPGNWDNSYGPTKIRNMDKNDYNYFRTWIDWWLGRRTNKKLVSGLENVYDLQYGLYRDDFVNLIGYGNISGPERFDRFKKRSKDYDYDDLQRKELMTISSEIPKRLNKLFFKRNRNVPTIFVSHNVPYGVLDTIVDKSNHANGKHTGSMVARDFCLKNKPEVCVGGHVHEHYAKKRLKDTVVVNAGFGSDAQVLIDIKAGSKKKKVDGRNPKIKFEFVESLRKRYKKKYFRK